MRVNEGLSLGFGPVFRGITLVSGDIAKVSPLIYRHGDDGQREKDTKHPLYWLLKYAPNDEMTAFNWRQAMVSSLVLRGNCYSLVDRSRNGKVNRIVFMDPARTFPMRENGRFFYAYYLEGEAKPIKIEPTMVLHGRAFTRDGITGYGILDYARETIGEGMAMREYSARFFRNNAKPSVILEHPGLISAAAYAKLLANWNKAYSGVENAHKAAILEEGMKASAMTMSAEESQLLEGRKFNRDEIANFLRVPVHKLGGDSHTSYNSLEQENQAYLDEALDPLMTCLEHEMWSKLLTEAEKRAESHTIEFQREELVRVDLGTKTESISKALAGQPWMLVDEARRKFNMNDLPNDEGKQYRPAANVGGNPDQSKGEDPAPDATDPQDSGNSDIPTDTTNSERMDTNKVRQSAESLALQVTTRMVKRLTVQAVKATKKPGEYKDWLAGLRTQHEPAIRDAYAPVASLIASFTAQSSTDVLERALDKTFSDVTGAIAERVVINPCHSFAEECAEDLNAQLPPRIVEALFNG